MLYLDPVQLRPDTVLELTEVVTAMMVPGRKAAGARLSLVLRMNRQRFTPELVRELMTLLPESGEEAPEPLLADAERMLA